MGCDNTCRAKPVNRTRDGLSETLLQTPTVAKTLAGAADEAAIHFKIAVALRHKKVIPIGKRCKLLLTHVNKRLHVVRRTRRHDNRDVSHPAVSALISAIMGD